MHAAQFTAAERSYEARLLAEIEADDDNGLLTEAQALEQASDEFENDAYAFAWWLNNDAGIEVRKPSEVKSVFALETEYQDGRELTNTELLQVLMTGHGNLELHAKYELRRRYLAHPATVELIEGRAAEILAAQEEQEREAEGAHYDAMAELREAA